MKMMENVRNLLSNFCKLPNKLTLTKVSFYILWFTFFSLFFSTNFTLGSGIFIRKEKEKKTYNVLFPLLFSFYNWYFIVLIWETEMKNEIE